MYILKNCSLMSIFFLMIILDHPKATHGLPPRWLVPVLGQVWSWIPKMTWKIEGNPAHPLIDWSTNRTIHINVYPLCRNCNKDLLDDSEIEKEVPDPLSTYAATLNIDPTTSTLHPPRVPPPPLSNSFVYGSMSSPHNSRIRSFGNRGTTQNLRRAGAGVANRGLGDEMWFNTEENL